METASVSVRVVIDQQTDQLIEVLHLATVSTDNAYAQARRLRQWAKPGGVFLSPDVKWAQGHDAQAYRDDLD